MQNIDMRFSYDGQDTPAMQRPVEAVILSIERLVTKAAGAAYIDAKLLHASLCVPAHASARAQKEYMPVRDVSL